MFKDFKDPNESELRFDCNIKSNKTINLVSYNIFLSYFSHL